MQTPHLPQAIFGNDFENVYEPAEDTFLLLDALEADLDYIRSGTDICLECGSGSGTIITALAKALSPDKTSGNESLPRLMLATDINLEACRTTNKCATYHGQRENIQVIRTNLAESLVDRLGGSVDLLIFNPPYVPTEKDERFDSKQLEQSWAGGACGRKLIDIFLKKYVPKLLSKPNGVAYLVAVDANKIDELTKCIVGEHNIEGVVVFQRRAGIEFLNVVKYKWIT